MAPQITRGLASLRDLATRQVEQLRTRRIDNPPQSASRTMKPIRPQRSVPPLSAVQRGNRTGLVLAAGIVLVGALAATSPLLWRKDPVPAAPQTSAPSPGADARAGLPQAATIPAGTPSGASPAARPPLPPSPAVPAQTPPPTTESPPRPTATAPAEPLSHRQVVQLQDRLRMLGFNPGRSDGLVGPRTVAAIREFQAAHGFPMTGAADTKLLEDVLFIQAATMSKPGTR
jgi:peptidoglycan hydrolase-like protein with peptidoglycan-binding domain